MGPSLVSERAEAGFEVVMGADGGVAAEELARHGVRPGAHLRVVATVERPEIRPIYGVLRGQVHEVSWEDFEAAAASPSGTPSPVRRFPRGEGPRRYARARLVRRG